jgi:hypothetical protein
VKQVILTITLCILLAGMAPSQNKMAKLDSLTIKHIAGDFSIARLDAPTWDGASKTVVATYWSGEKAPEQRQFDVRLLWSDASLYVRFDASQGEPLVVSEKPDLTKKVVGLWDRDVCEIFIAPDASQRNKYFEFEIAPNGEWIDLGIEVTPKERRTDWDYRSGMTSAAKVEKGKVIMAIKIPFASLGKAPKVGDVWLGNLFRCVGKDPTRGYLAWRPTETPKSNFHVPEKFGEFHFVK